MADLQFKFTVDGSAQSGLSLAFQGRLMEEIDTARTRIERAYPKAMDKGVTQPGKRQLRATIEATGFYKAAALAKTWRGYTYPSSQPTLEPAAFFKSRAGVIVDAFDAGVVITAKYGKYLAIPEGPAKGVIHNLNRAANRSREGGKFAKEDSPVARVAAALGTDLVPIIDEKTNRGVLVATSGARLTRTGRMAKNQRGSATVLFALVRQATLKPRPMGREVLRRIEANFLTDFTGALAAELDPKDR
jgi:hypothetical protein